MEDQESDISEVEALTQAHAKCLQLLNSDFLVKTKATRVKTVLMTQDAGDDSDLSCYRMDLIAKITANIYKQGGWKVLTKEDSTPLDVHWNLTLNSYRPSMCEPLRSQLMSIPCVVDGKSTMVMVPSMKGSAPDEPESYAMRIVCGVVRNLATKQRERIVTMQDYISLREKDLRECECSDALVEATVKLEMLHVRSANTITLDLSPGPLVNRGASNKGAAFFMYNYARLATLLRRHADGVAKGQYPELPPVETVVPIIVSSVDEHSLLKTCLGGYSSILSEFESAMRKSHYPEPHKLCNFLSQMCQALSKYYRTHHVLTEPREHLLPIMHARLHLLSAILRVMDRVYALLEIIPPQHMWSWNPEKTGDDGEWSSKRELKRKRPGGNPSVTQPLQKMHL